MKIMLAVDGSEFTKRMLAHVAANPELLAGRHDYVAITVVPAIPAYAARLLDRSQVDGYYEEEAEKVLGPVRSFAAMKGWSLREVALHGRAADVIADFAQAEKPDLLVMGTHGHSRIGNVLLGSVATGVIAGTKVPVLLVR